MVPLRGFEPRLPDRESGLLVQLEDRGLALSRRIELRFTDRKSGVLPLDDESAARSTVLSHRVDLVLTLP